MLRGRYEQREEAAVLGRKIKLIYIQIQLDYHVSFNTEVSVISAAEYTHYSCLKEPEN